MILIPREQEGGVDGERMAGWLVRRERAAPQEPFAERITIAVLPSKAAKVFLFPIFHHRSSCAERQMSERNRESESGGDFGECARKSAFNLP